MVDMILVNRHRNHLGQTDVNNGDFWASAMKSVEVGQASGIVQSEAQLVESWKMFTNQLWGERKDGGQGEKEEEREKEKKKQQP